MKFVKEGFKIRLVGCIITIIFALLFVIKTNWNYWWGMIIGYMILLIGGSKLVLRRKQK